MRGIALFIIALAGASAPALAAERSFTVAGFDRVRAAGPFDVHVHVGGPVSVRASGPQAALDRLEIVSERGQLTLRTVRDDGSNGRNWFSGRERVVVNVTVPALSAVALTGSGDVSVDGAHGRSFAAALSGSGDMTLAGLRAESAALDISGSGDLTVSGDVGSAKASIFGSGDIRGGALRAGSAAIALSGSGNVELAAQRSAAVSLNGSGDVTVTGPARCMIVKHGSGEVRCRG